MDDHLDENTSPRSLIPVHRPKTLDIHSELRLLHDLKIANENARVLRRTKSSIGACESASPEKSDVENIGDQPVRLTTLLVAAAVSGSTVQASTAYSSALKVDAVERLAPHTQGGHVDRIPTWPKSSVGEREISRAVGTSPLDILVEEVDGEWVAWIIAAGKDGSVAMDFFSGKRLTDVRLGANPAKPSFTDANGEVHEQVGDLGLSVAHDDQGLYAGQLRLNADLIFFDCDGCAQDINTAERVDPEILHGALWKKVAFYLQDGEWASRINSAVDLRDGTVLLAGGRFAFRVNERDLSPVGSAPSLRVVDEKAVRKLLDKAEREHVDVTDAYLADHLGL